MKQGTCNFCKKTFTYNAYTNKGKYCNNKCQGLERSKNQTQININLLKEGKLKDNNRQRIKKTLLSMGVENKCAICNIKDWQNQPLPLVLDHIDGNAKNNKFENLRLICSNCDSQTKFYKGRNKGFGRKSLGLL
jgi:hypothetical protein